MNVTESMNRQSLDSNSSIEINETHSPITWINTILRHVKNKSDNRIEKYLVGAKLQKRYADFPVPNQPVHSADVQTERLGDFSIHKTVYHITAAPSQAVIQKCSANLRAGKHPILLVPQEKKATALAFAELEHLEKQISIISIEDFVTINIIEMSSGEKRDFFQILQEIIEIYNKRLSEVETDMSLRIEVK